MLFYLDQECAFGEDTSTAYCGGELGKRYPRSSSKSILNNTAGRWAHPAIVLGHPCPCWTFGALFFAVL